MPLPTTITDISTTASLNYPKGNNNISLTDDYLRQIQAILRTVYDAQAATNTSVSEDITTLEGLVALLDSKSLPYAETTGTSSAYLASLGTGVVSVDDGTAYILKFHTACAANPTLQVNGLLPILDIKLPRSDGTLAPVAAGDIGADDILLGIVNQAGTSFIVVPNVERTNVTYLSTATTLTVETALDINLVLTATATHTLPLLSTFIEGGSFNVTANATATIQRQGSDVISLNGADVNSVTLKAGDSVDFVKSSGKWLVSGLNESIQLLPTIDTTSGTSHTFTLPRPNPKKLTLSFNGVSTNGTSIVIVRLNGESTGYSQTAAQGHGAFNTGTTGFSTNSSHVATFSYAGDMQIKQSAPDGLSWVATGILSEQVTPRVLTVAGRKTISSSLTSISVTTINGTDTFDGGFIGLQVEY